MLKVASIFPFLAVLAALAAGPALGAEPPAASSPESGAEPAAGDLRCHDKPLLARGVGFVPSKKDAEEAAKTAWLPKAQEVFADATWETAQKAAFLCAKQGLYMNCTASAIPCGTTPGVPAETKGNSSP